MTFKSVDEMKRYILEHSKSAVAEATEEVYQMMDMILKQFYAEFTPEEYDRTYQLLQSCVKTGVKATGNGFVAEVYFDSGMLSYTTGNMPSGSQVMTAALKGGHGAEGEGFMAYYGYTPIGDASKSLIQSRIRPLMIEALNNAGIPVR